MACLEINLNCTSGLKSSISRAVDKFESRINDYNGIIKDTNNIPSRTGNLSNCNVYLKKKRDLLQNKIDKLNDFKGRVSAFSENAEQADQRVSTYVKDQSEHFYKTMGIKTGLAAAWEDTKKFFKGVWKGVKEFYEKHKFVIDFLVDIALLAVAVVAVLAAIPTGGASLFFAGFALAGALGDTVTSSIALGYHIAGDDATAGVWAERGTKDAVKWVGGLIDKGYELFTGKQTDFCSSLFGFAYDAISIASIGYSLGKGAKSLFKSFDFRNTNNLSVWKRITNAGKAVFGFNTTDYSGKTLAGCWQIKQLLGLKSVDNARKMIVGCNFFKNLRTGVNITNSIYKNEFFGDGLKIVKDINKLTQTIKSAYRETLDMAY